MIRFLRKIQNLLHKGIGLNRLQNEVKDLVAALERNDLALGQRLDARLEQNDLLLQRRLDEKLKFYCSQRIPINFSVGGQLFIHTLDGHRLFVDPRESFMALHLLEHGVWEAPVRRELQRELASGSVFIDIGANIGLHTLLAASLVGPEGKVLALEPHPITREFLRKNVEINGLLDVVEILGFAVSDVDCANVPFQYFVEHSAMSGFCVAKEIIEKFNGTVERIDVLTTTVDTLVTKHNVAPDLIKIDVEGFEYSVLLGCEQTIEAHRDVRFLIEHERAMAESVMRTGIGGEIADFFGKRGFHVSRVDDGGLKEMSFGEFSQDVRGDYLFYR